MQALVEAKREGDEIVVGAQEQPSTKVVDLMEVLSASIESVKAGGKAGLRPEVAAKSPATKPPAAKKATSARKAASAKSPTSITSKRAAKQAAPTRKAGAGKAPAKTASRRRAS